MDKCYEIVISRQTGEVSIDAKGFTGKTCLTGIENVIEALGAVSSMTKKPEFDMDDTVDTLLVH